MIKPMTVGDLRPIEISPPPATARSDDEQSAAVDRWSSMTTVELWATVAKRADAQRMLDEADEAEAADLFDRAEALVPAAE